jgi:hypothetical protein
MVTTIAVGGQGREIRAQGGAIFEIHLTVNEILKVRERMSGLR